MIVNWLNLFCLALDLLNILSVIKWILNKMSLSSQNLNPPFGFPGRGEPRLPGAGCSCKASWLCPCSYMYGERSLG